jgi:hypothetical protein|tara:strand:+ start:2790 stop:3290 length:501 start_codon:yes stop_codon:yes gene_type:complete
MNDQLKLSNGQVVDAVFLGLDSEGTGQYGNWFKYSLKVDGKEMIYFANDNQKPIFESLKRDESFKFGKMKKENAKGTYHKVERVDADTPATTTTTTNNSTTSNDTRTFSQREASIVAGVAVKVAGWSIAPGSFTEQELLNRSKVVLSVLNKLETDLLTQQIEEIFE